MLWILTFSVLGPQIANQAGWFAADAMPTMFPGKVSIAQWLIRDFLERNGQSVPD